MENITVAYQHVCEIALSHQYVTATQPALPATEWIQWYPDIATLQLLDDKKLTVRAFNGGLRLITAIKADKDPICDLSNTNIRIGFTFIPAVAAHTKLDAHFLVGNQEGRYVFGNAIAKANGSTYPDISQQTVTVAAPTDSERLFGYIEINIIRGPGNYDLLDTGGKLKYQKGTANSKFSLIFQQ
ncbi:hypothetical protein HHL17_23380 [Chitinophaga sp. G-6-1-13]|uniref:Uncharacterized protein n=1 Tax=Chitinophaga fulva TaxID=2728842 RepID=A0A848GRL9_9BACT|nr:hypothetical protein [Chitinophaga fulva]NML40161.1 hypothetical protein [Chitinophaga fulva]